jgi:hypothetical protein
VVQGRVGMAVAFCERGRKEPRDPWRMIGYLHYPC